MFFLGTTNAVRPRARGSWRLERGGLSGSVVQSEVQQAETELCSIIVTSYLIVTEAPRGRCMLHFTYEEMMFRDVNDLSMPTQSVGHS